MRDGGFEFFSHTKHSFFSFVFVFKISTTRTHKTTKNTKAVGYAGRPGGPNFYINVEDNRALHGPGGQDGKKGQENSPRGEADPCFARVVDGFAVVDRLHRLPVTDQSDGFVLEDRVTVADLQLLVVPANGNAADADANAKE